MNPSTAKLHSVTDELTDRLVEVNALLNRTFHGVTARVELPTGEYLAFRRWSSVWQLCVEEEGGGTASPLANAARSTRIAAAAFLSPLRAALVRAAAEEEARVEGAIATCQAFLHEFGEKS